MRQYRPQSLSPLPRLLQSRRRQRRQGVVRDLPQDRHRRQTHISLSPVPRRRRVGPRQKPVRVSVATVLGGLVAKVGEAAAGPVTGAGEEDDKKEGAVYAGPVEGVGED